MKTLTYIALLLLVGCSSQRAHSPQLDSGLSSDDSDLSFDLRRVQSWMPTKASTTDVEHIMGQHGFGCIHTKYPDGSSAIICARGTSTVVIAVTESVPRVVGGHEIKWRP